MTTTWTEIVPVLIRMTGEEHAPLVRQLAMDELMKLAWIVDKHIASLERLKGALPEPPASADTSEPCPRCGIRGAHVFGCADAADAEHDPCDGPYCGCKYPTPEERDA